ncbi:MAG TPA: NAD kinase [Xanthomonadaceae bacterium]|nr:NAD kinase [Xanthomonadaceae bacterium]
MKADRIAFVASRTPQGEDALRALTAEHGQCGVEDADVIVTLGGDGFMLQTLHRHGRLGLPVYGMKLGTVGFLMNQYRPEQLRERIEAALPAVLHPLEMSAHSDAGTTVQALAFNEVSLLRQTKQAAKIAVYLNGEKRMEELVCDGVLLSTPAGSTAYNLSAHGPILPLDSHTLALTPISPFRPRRWRGAIVRAETRVRFEILDPYKRPVSATADSSEVRDVVDVEIRESPEVTVTMLFDPEHSLEERILTEQFTA